MTHRGFSHIGLSTLDLDKTREFYEGVLGFKTVVADTIKIEEGGHLRHLFFDVGHGQLIAFLEPNGVPDVPTEIRCGHQPRARGAGRLLSFCFRSRLAGGAGREARRATRERRGDHRYRRSRMGSVDLLQRSQRPFARMLLHGAQSDRR
jgi:catechol 2,3-dioxygenase-like lactoylglutathione lyase family enzyme